jgi:hypothetical protein
VRIQKVNESDPNPEPSPVHQQEKTEQSEGGEDFDYSDFEVEEPQG